MLSSQECKEIKALRKEIAQLRRANEILKSATCFRWRARPTPSEVSAYIDEHRDRVRAEPICRALGVSASAYYERAAGCGSARSIENEQLLARIAELHEASYSAWGYRRT